MLSPAMANMAAASSGQIQRCRSRRPNPTDKPRVTRVTPADCLAILEGASMSGGTKGQEPAVRRQGLGRFDPQGPFIVPHEAQVVEDLQEGAVFDGGLCFELG